MLNTSHFIAAWQRFSARGAVLFGLCLAGAGCTDEYLPDVIKAPDALLVVDGFINSQGVSTFRLSRTYAIGNKTAPPAETKATAYIEEESGPRYALRESPAGTYASTALALNPAKRYRLHLNTTGGQEFASDYAPVKTTPAIDAVQWRFENGNVNVSVDTHDASNSTRYYRWETDETWEINPPYRPSVEYVNRAMRPIVVPFPIICYGTAHSAIVQLEKTTALTEDVVSGFRLRQLAGTSERLSTRYSILVQQQALTKEEFGYWELLRKNTESIGTLFDPQPSQLTGNVHCLSNSDQTALGFVGVHSVTEKRIFITNRELPRGVVPLSGYESCVPPDTVDLYPPTPKPPTPAEIMQTTFGVSGGFYVPIEPQYDKTGRIVLTYTTKTLDCIDCRKRGSATKPSFWP